MDFWLADVQHLQHWGPKVHMLCRSQLGLPLVAAPFVCPPRHTIDHACRVRADQRHSTPDVPLQRSQCSPYLSSVIGLLFVRGQWMCYIPVAVIPKIHAVFPHPARN